VVRCAVVGLDSAFWPAAFRQAILDHPDAELAGMCGVGLAPDVITRDFVADVDTWLAERGERRIGTLDEQLEVGFDAAFVCSRISAMPSLVERLVAEGKHVFVAKPMGVNASDIARYLPVDGVVVTAGQLARTWEPWPTMRALVAAGRIGSVLSMHAVHQHGSYRDFPDQLWYADPAEGDAFGWLGWYAVDAVHAVMGRIATVRGVGRRLASAHGDLPDQLAAIFELADGRHASADVYWTIGPWGMAMQEGQIVGDAGVVRFHGPGGTVQLLTAAGEVRIPFVPGDGLRVEVDAFLAAVQGAGAASIALADAVHVATVCAAWREAAGTGATVRID
jgi:predicted dehydrogenase